MTEITLNEGDIITVKCKVRHGTGWGHGLAFVRPLEGHSDFTVEPEAFDRIVRREFKVGQKVVKPVVGRTHSQIGTVETVLRSGDYLVVTTDDCGDPCIWAAEKCEPVPEVDPDDEVDDAAGTMFDPPPAAPALESAAE